MNLPNKLTLARVLLIPVFIAFMEFDTIPGAYLIAAGVFSVASFTDYLDGNIARKYNMVSDFGKFADPLADKLLTTTAIIYMVIQGLCPPLVLVLIISREFAVSGVRMVAAAAGGKVIAANIWGKLKTVLQMAAILTAYILVGLQNAGILFANNIEWPHVFSNAVMWIVGAVTLLSGAQYLWQNRQFINTAK